MTIYHESIPSVQGRASRERGISMTVVLVAAAPLLLAAGSLLSLVVAHQQESEITMGEETASLVATSGAQQALASLELTPGFQGNFQLGINGGTAAVTVTPWFTDGVDNDDNGLIDDTGEDGFSFIDSVGWWNVRLDAAGNPLPQPGRAYRAEAEVVAEEHVLALSFEQTIYIDDPNALIDFNGGSLMLSGNDTDLNGSPGGELPRPAIGVNGDPSLILAQIAGNQQNLIVGSLPDPAIGQTNPVDVQPIRDLVDAAATVRWDVPAASHSGTLGTAASPVVAYAAGDLKFHGNTPGMGILYVDGDLEIDGHFQFVGVIFVRGTVSFQGGGGRKELTGALLVWGQPSTPQVPIVEINGTVQIVYSSDALSRLPTLSGVDVVFWRER